MARLRRVARDDLEAAGQAQLCTALALTALLSSAVWLARGVSATPLVDPQVALAAFGALLLVWLGLTARLSWAAFWLSAWHAALMGALLPMPLG